MSTDAPSQNMQKTNLRRKWLIVLAMLFCGFGIIFLIYWLLVLRFQVSTDDAYVRGNNVPVMSEISGYVRTILVDETQAVEQGQKLIELDKADADIALNAAKAELALTARNVSQLYSNVKQLQANVDVAKDVLERADEDLARREGLAVNKTISAEELEHTKNTAKNAKDALVLVTQQLETAKDLVSGVDLYHHPQIQQAIVKLRNAYLNWLRTVIYSPTQGYVAKRAVQVGQAISTNTILMIIVPLNKVWIDANFKESQLSDLRIGQPVTITCDAYGSSISYKGKVVGLSPGTGSVFDLLPPQNATGNWIKIVQRLPVRIEIDEAQLLKYPLRVGLSANVTVETKDKKGPSLSPITPSQVIYNSLNDNERLKEVDSIIDEILKANAQNRQSHSEKHSSVSTLFRVL